MSQLHISHEKRIELGAFLRAGKKQKEIATLLNVHPSSISRELQRNGTRYGKYFVKKAQRRCDERRTKANQRFRKIGRNETLKGYVVRKLKKYWSPEQIAGRLKRKHGRTIICHETIYEFIYEKRFDLAKYLRCRKGKYRKRHGTRKRQQERERLKKRRIDIRPIIVETRERIGDWEGDTIVGGERTTAILTNVERRSGFLIADKLEQSLSELVKEITIARFKKFPKKKRHTMTYDNGHEFTDHEIIERNTGMMIYFAYPYHSWERGTNENTNGLLRQFFPKRSLFARITQPQLDKVVQLINTRPRKRLHYLTPSEVFKKNCDLD
jgi:IS30 family transposase